LKKIFFDRKKNKNGSYYMKKKCTFADD